MEQMIFEEFGKYKNTLKNELLKKYKDKLKEADIDNILTTLDGIIYQMVELMREGKSVHEKFFSDIILNSVDAIIGINKEGKIFLWNKGAENLLGYKKEEIVGKGFKHLIPQHLLEKGEYEFIIEEVRKKGFIRNYLTERITKTGEIVNVVLTRFSIFDDKGEFLGTVGILRDVTNEIKLEKELREKENLALIGEVVSSIAHNLSNPLNIIAGNAEYLLLDRKETDEGYEELKIITEETKRITKAIRQILNFSRPIFLTLEEADINDIIQEIITKIDFLSHQKKINIKLNLASKLSSLKIDKALIRDVLLNLLNNAIHAVKDNGKITISTSMKDKKIIIKISDDGCGIKPENLSKIFKPFFTTKLHGAGTGLGLSFAQRIVKMHNGTIEVESTPEKGSTFSVILPIQ
ncbi:MAG: two-component system sensor histidine kinase NtrB [Ignavibacteria bacterium]